jgi:hypothetical protein
MTGTECQYGMLLDGEVPLGTAMALSAGEPLHIDGLTGPKVSAHLAVVLEEDLHGCGLTAARTLIAVEAVFGALLVTDGNNAPVHYLTGPAAGSVNDVDLMLEGCLLEVDGQIVDSATAAAVRPVETLTRVARRRLLLSGTVLLTAALTEPSRSGRDSGWQRTSARSVHSPSRSVKGSVWTWRIPRLDRYRRVKPPRGHANDLCHTRFPCSGPRTRIMLGPGTPNGGSQHLRVVSHESALTYADNGEFTLVS